MSPALCFGVPVDSFIAAAGGKHGVLVRNAKSASEAAQVLNREFFKLLNVNYNPGRATCTGLSIILVRASRAVGIPARAVGTPMWSNGRRNHTLAEILEGNWHFLGADEYDAQGINRGWFIGDAAQAQANPEHAIYATSWKRDQLAFPMVWTDGVRLARSTSPRATQTPRPVPASREDAEVAIEPLASDRLLGLTAGRKDEHEKKSITIVDKTMHGLEKLFGKAPAGGRSLWISMHGGGGAPAAVNDGQS